MRTGRRTAVREKQSGGLFFSPRVLPPSPPRRRKRHIACGDFFAKVTSRSFCCASFSPQNLAARFFAGSLCLFAAPKTRTSFEVRVLFSHALKSDWTVKRSPLPGIGSGLSVLSISLRNYTLIHCFSLNYLYQNNRFSFRL